MRYLFTVAIMLVAMPARGEGEGTLDHSKAVCIEAYIAKAREGGHDARIYGALHSAGEESITGHDVKSMTIIGSVQGASGKWHDVSGICQLNKVISPSSTLRNEILKSIFLVCVQGSAIIKVDDVSFC